MPAKKDWSNAEIAQLFRRMAAAYELRGGDFFRIQAYQNAAESIDHLGANLRDLWEQDKLDEVAGLGESLREHLDELFRTGRVKHFREVMAGFPEGTYILLDLPDIGPKTALKIAKQLKLTSEKTALKKLSASLESGKLNGVPGIGPKTIAGLQEAIASAPKKGMGERLFLPDAEAVAEDVLAYLKDFSAVQDAEAMGSLRRHSSTVGDIDIGVKSDEPLKVLEHLKRFPNLKRLTAVGENTAMIVHTSGRQVDIKVHESRGWGSMLQHYTGSKAHNIHLRTLAKQRGLSLSEYGIKTKNGQQYFTDEAAFYAALGMQYIPPELREDSGEIEAAQKHALPALVELQDIRGDLHVHSNLDWPSSHDMGKSSFDELFNQAKENGYEYLGISDHQPKSSLSAVDRRRFVEKRNEQIDRALERWQKRTGGNLKVLKGLEVDIRPDGSLALEDESLQSLDYALVSVHSSFNQSKKDATKRVLRALSHPKATLWGHPTGRMIGGRKGLEYDWQEVFSFCAKEGKIIEVNASPRRLDLPDALIQIALEKGIKLAVNTDSHDAEHLSFMKYGVWTARRGWAQAKDVVNTLSWKQLSAHLG